MGIEIEKKFLVKDDSWKTYANGKKYCQGYISSGNNITVRVRINEDMGFITIKSGLGFGKRLEFEYNIPVEDAKEMLHKLCRKPLIEKMRYEVVHKGITWEIDVFDGENKGLVLAEAELENSDQKIELPNWVGREVTADLKYYNSRLVIYPFSKWNENDKKEYLT